MREVGQGKGLKPNPARTGERGKKNTVTAKEHIPDPLNPGDLKLDTSFEHPDMTRMDSHRFSLPQVVGHNLPVEFNPCLASARHPLQQEAIAPEDPSPKRLLKSDTEVNPRGRTQKPVTMNHVSLIGPHFDRQDMTRNPSGKGQDPRLALR